MRRSYGSDFKREAVRLSYEPGQTVQKVASELGICSNSLSHWRGQFRNDPDRAFPGSGNPRDQEMAKMKEELRRDFPIQRMAIVMGVSRMGYYSWRRRAEARRVKQKAEDRLVEQIAAIQQTHRKRYGSRRVCATLERGRVSVGRHRVSRLMRENGLTAKYPKPYRGTTKGAAVTEQNVLVTEGPLTGITQAWASDITY